MTTKHTPGPWTARKPWRDGAPVPGANFIEAPRSVVADIQPWMGESSEADESCYAEADANARLIAGAPELLEALGWIVEFIGEHPEWANEQFPADSAEGDWLVAARAAIEKAERGAS